MTVLAEDTFTDTDGVTLATHVPTGIVPGTVYVDYGTLGGSRLVINNNRINHNSAAGNDAASLLDKATAYPNDYEVSADLVFLSAGVMAEIGLLARGNSVDFAAYKARWASSGNWQLVRLNASASQLQLGSDVPFAFPGSPPVTKKLALRVSGTSISLYVDDVLTIGPITNSDVATGKPGLWLNASSAQTGVTGVVLDNLKASDLTVASGQAPAEHDAYFPLAAPAPGPNLLFY